MNENKTAYYVHCFAHQLQLALVAVARKHVDVADFFNMISTLMNVVGASCKRKDMIRQNRAEKIAQGILNGEIQTGKGLNQELSLKRAGDTRWGSHYKSLLNLVSLFSSVIEVLEFVSCDASDSSKKAQARGLLRYLQSFDFVFNLQLMLTILGITNELSLALQKKDEYILNAIALVKVAMGRLENLRNDGWESLIGKIIAFCNKHKIDVLNMEEAYVDPYHPRRKSNTLNQFHYRVEFFYMIVDMQLLELNDRFDEINSELLLCVGCLNPSDGFSDFNLSKLIKLAQFYPDDFSHIECMILEHQLETYIADVRTDDRFSQLKGLGDLSRLLVQTKKHLSFPLVYRLLKLALVLPIATASVERCFSGMNIVKTDLRNRMSDQFLNDCLVCFIEKELLGTITKDVVIERFQKMKTRREQL